MPVRVDVLPGSINRYSGGGYTVAQQLMIDVTGKPFPSLMSELVLRPLGMGESTYKQPLPAALAGQAPAPTVGTQADPRPASHLSRDGGGRPLDDADRLAGSRLKCSARSRGSRDHPGIHRPEMTTNVIDNYGLGLGLSGTGAAARFGHGGSNEGFECQMTAFMSAARAPS